MESEEWRVRSEEWRVESGQQRIMGTGTGLTTWLRFLNDRAETDKMLNVRV